MTGKSRGFTLIELMIVVAVLAIMATVAVPSLISARLAANESAAVSTLRSLVTAQAQFRTIGAVDADQDGAGEYGTFGEMSGRTLLNVRGAGPALALEPPILGSPFEQIDAGGRARRSGYLFRMFLPDANNLGLGELPGGGPDPLVEADHCEFSWCCYAWPYNPSVTGNRAFFVDARGEIFQTVMDGVTYDANNAPAFDAALTAPDMGAVVAINGAASQDGNTWTTASR